MNTRGAKPSSVVGALGVVYGDIGTSPLYALEQSVKATGQETIDSALMFGVLSLMFWSLLVVVTLKYVVLMLRADNQGEGGILSLFALVQRHLASAGRYRAHLIALAVLGAALYYCDALITPAISMLSAVEGLQLLDPGFKKLILPITIGIVVALFAIQHRGTESVGKVFGPVMVLWFLVLGISGVTSIVQNPAVLQALNPVWAIQLLSAHAGTSLIIVGAVFLALTGSEALYADMGHFGKLPVRIAWFGLVWPALLLNYFGQGALLLRTPEAVSDPLYHLLPQGLLPAMVVLATAATVIASQAVISSAFSITRQAIQLDFLPRMRVLQTSAEAHGQIYVPAINHILMIAVALFVIAFGSSDALAAAYGAAVAGTMLITTILASFLARREWQWSLSGVALVFTPLLLIDATFVTGNLTKFKEGAWVPIALATLLFSLFMIWRSGRLQLRNALALLAVPIGEIGKVLQGVQRVPGTAVFLASTADSVPSALLRNIEHNHVAHERIVILNLEIARTPRQDPTDRVRFEEFMPEVFLLRARFGYMETPDVSEALKRARARGLKIFVADCSFFVGWHLVIPRPRGGYAGIKRRMFAWMQRRSTQASEFFRMPERRVIALVTQVEI
ncbi:MAG: KUP/HAK/KT family potassium transporter [Steroidobacteraceae bacterium]